ncbi:hypothetical protein ACFOUP_05610 [Belliella kenyensis]|uniref:Auto-transporter adhesin head GIN domain-containing protein n=1 Tax=Belliella kenyensis TaxID=1472724 RepID=A0ABV8EHY2_9BACT|nr:hypothetical protein [Belliella kenyensis]MCH7402771.1 hypothetical protein [Belliella kenyensis]MDN3603681.1 hypothetical protein [Belliella kenyensis]
MKTSNKLLIFFLSISWLGIVSGWLYSAAHTSEKRLAFQKELDLNKQNGTPFKVADMDYQKDLIEGEFSVVSVSNSGHVFVFTDSIPGIVQTNPKDKKVASEKDERYSFEVKEDTLFIRGIHQKKFVAYTLQVGTQVRSFVIDSVATLDLFAGRNFIEDSLSITSSNSTFVLGPDLSVGSLKYTGRSSSVLQAYASIKHLDIDMERSKVVIHHGLDDVNGEIKDFSELALPKSTKEVNLKKDTNSKFYFRN